jgi:hypothetical protein
MFARPFPSTAVLVAVLAAVLVCCARSTLAEAVRTDPQSVEAGGKEQCSGRAGEHGHCHHGSEHASEDVHHHGHQQHKDDSHLHGGHHRQHHHHSHDHQHHHDHANHAHEHCDHASGHHHGHEHRSPAAASPPWLVWLNGRPQFSAITSAMAIRRACHPFSLPPSPSPTLQPSPHLSFILHLFMPRCHVAVSSLLTPMIVPVPSSLLLSFRSSEATGFRLPSPSTTSSLPPACRGRSLLKLMNAFSVGGLLGDVFLHIIPHRRHHHTRALKNHALVPLTRAAALRECCVEGSATEITCTLATSCRSLCLSLQVAPLDAGGFAPELVCSRQRRHPSLLFIRESGQQIEPIRRSLRPLPLPSSLPRIENQKQDLQIRPLSSLRIPLCFIHHRRL